MAHHNHNPRLLTSLLVMGAAKHSLSPYFYGLARVVSGCRLCLVDMLVGRCYFVVILVVVLKVPSDARVPMFHLY